MIYVRCWMHDVGLLKNLKTLPYIVQHTSDIVHLDVSKNYFVCLSDPPIFAHGNKKFSRFQQNSPGQ